MTYINKLLEELNIF